MQTSSQPCPDNNYLSAHAELLISSYHHWTGKNLLTEQNNSPTAAYNLFSAPYCLVSHNTDSDPIFNYGNQSALTLFAMNWEDFTQLPSRKSAETINREERNRLMTGVSNNGFIDDYQGIRISATGKRFLIQNATVWNIIDACGDYHGQAAVFYQWSEL